MYRSQHQRLASAIATQKRRDAHDEWVLAVAATAQPPITPPVDADYVVPLHL